MQSIRDYLKWRGDLTFEADLFRPIDSLILSIICYIDLDEILPGIYSNDSITLREAADRYWNGDFDEVRVEKKYMDNGLEWSRRMLFREAADTARFGMLRVGKYVNQIDEQGQKQFAAMTFLLSNRDVYIAFRGTDDTLVGWKEDFNMSYMTSVPAQIEACKYLDESADWTYDRIFVGGHSKGGNLAIYSSLKCRSTIRDRIVSIDNFDGPGFSKEFMEKEPFDLIEDRIINYIPQGSIIGTLLRSVGRTKIIQSNQKGIMQHDALSWAVLGGNFEYTENLERGSELLGKALNEWIDKLNVEQRGCFVDIVFGILVESGVESTLDLFEKSNPMRMNFIKTLSALPSENRDVIIHTIKVFFAESRRVVQKELTKKVKKEK